MERGNRARGVWALLALAAPVGWPAPGSAQIRYDREYPPIAYSTRAPTDRVARLWERVRRGEVTLTHEGPSGYLGDLLEALEIPTSSQALVFTRTSFQASLITPEKPRAIYFNDDAYVAFVQGSDVLEISAVDPVLGGVFYSLAQDPERHGDFAREMDLCLQCHDSYGLTGGGVPRYLVGSMLPDENGQPVHHEGWQLTDDRTPFERRWGGWYVTGTHGGLLHRGNAIVRAAADPGSIDLSVTGNRTSLEGVVDTAPYPSAHSDIVALMVLEHQVRVQNAITRLGYDARTALHRDEAEGRAPASGQARASAETLAVVERSGEPLVEALLMVDEARLEATVTGTSGFAEAFELAGVPDRAGRSLRDLDLRERLFRHPLSFMVYSATYDGLPGEARAYVARRLGAVLRGEDRSARFDHLTDADREAVLAIVRDTKPGLLDER